MLAKQQYATNIINLQDEVELRPGQPVGYLRYGRKLTGTFLATVTTEVKRYKIDGKHPVVTEYAVQPDGDASNLSVHVVSVVWAVQQ